MKKVTFSKLTVFGYRPGFPGYLLEHSAHPTRKFVIARTSVPRDRSRPLEGYNVGKGWAAYEMESGVPLAFPTMGVLRASTRERLVDMVRSALFLVSEAQIAERVSDFRSLVATKMLKGETP